MSNLSVENIVNPTTADTTPTDNLSKQIAKAWVNFNGTGVVAIRDSFNVSSITDIGTGGYTVNFTTPMSSANYVDAMNAGNTAGTQAGFYTTGAKLTTSFNIRTVNDGTNALTDFEFVSAIVFSN